MSDLQQPVLPLACLFYSILCCLWRVCSTAACVACGVSVLQQPVLPLACLFYSSLCCLWRVCSIAACAAFGVSVLQQPFLPLVCLFHKQLLLPLACLIYSSLFCLWRVCPRSSICCISRACSVADCAVSGVPVLQQPVLPLDVYFVQHPMLPLRICCTVEQTLLPFRAVLSYSSLCWNF